MAETTLTIEGMSCGHCVMRVKKALDALAGVTGSDVKVGIATVEFDESKISKDEITAAVEKTGYKTSAK
jgi:copper chaperone